jgi:tRNA(fMet)-specific endonuclease VapC
MRFALAHFDWLPIDRPAILDAYALIDAEMQITGHSMGKNDLWIAATCAGTGFRLLTTDRDFDRLVPTYLERDYIDPTP